MPAGIRAHTSGLIIQCGQCRRVLFKTFYDNLPQFLRKPLKEDSASKLVFHNGATILCTSASSKGGLRSFTCSYLLLSEFAFSENADELKATAVSAVNNGQMIIESTANYWGDPLHLEIETAMRGEANYEYLFFPWFEHKDYALKPGHDFILTEEEKELLDEYNLTEDQIAWRRNMIQKIGLDKFRREYPACIEDAYSQAGDAYLTEDDLKWVQEIDIENRSWVPIQPVNREDAYAIGVDVGSGIGKDYSVAIVLSKLTGQPVGIFRSNTTTPVDFASEIFAISQEYNNAKILCEANNVGIVVIQGLQGSNLWKTNDDKYWNTTAQNKRIAFEELKEAIRSGTLNILDAVTVGELRSIKLDKQYNISLTRANGAHADNAMALALAFQCLKNVRLPTRAFLPDWVKARKAEKIINAGNGSALRRY